MPSNTSASVFGGAGGRGSRVSVASLAGLRNVMRNDTERDSAPAAPVRSAAAAPVAQAAPAAPADDKQTLRGLNDRLSGYLGRVRQLENENCQLEKQIDEILARRKAPEGRDWDEVEKPLEDLKKKIKDITMDNAKLLLQIDNTKLANDDFKNKQEDEKKARKELEKDVEDLKKANGETKLNCKQTQKEMDLVREELARLQQEHKEEVDVLREKIKDSDVKVVIESKNTNLGEMLNNVRDQYDKLAKKNLKETEEWYQNKFENIKVVEAQNNEVLNSGKSELKELLKQKQSLEIRIQGLHSMIRNLEENLMGTKVEYNQRLTPLNQAIVDMETELKEVRAQVERQVEGNNDLLCVKMKLEAEINNYQQLMHGITADAESMEFSLEDGLHLDQQKPDAEVPEQQEVLKEETLVKQESAPPNQSAPPKAPGDATAEADKPPEEVEGDLIKAEEVAAQNTDAPKKKKPKTKNKNGSSSSSSSSSSSDENEEKPKNEGEIDKA